MARRLIVWFAVGLGGFVAIAGGLVLAGWTVVNDHPVWAYVVIAVLIFVGIGGLTYFERGWREIRHGPPRFPPTRGDRLF